MNNIHTKAMNLARRHSIRNENDLLQENMFDDNDGITDALSTEQHCSNLLEKYAVPSELPRECHKFQAAVQRRQSNREDQAIAFAGMNAHETLEAIRAREHGMPHHAKIQRRMTSNSGNHDSSRNPWF